MKSLLTSIRWLASVLLVALVIRPVSAQVAQTLSGSDSSKDGLHFYSPTIDNGTNIPSTIQVDLPDGMEFVGDWKTPTSENGHLGDGTTFQRVIRLEKTVQ